MNLGPSEIDPSEITFGPIIGDGTFSKVYQGICRSKPVAVKVFQRQYDASTLKSFREEVSILRSINHPNVALFMGASTTQPGKLMICSELLKGTLEDVLHDPTKKLSLVQRLRMAKDAALGLCWLHSASPAIIHRDIKPSNFLLDEHGHVKVTDFGLSQLMPRGSHLFDANGRARGTPLWMAPEVLTGHEFNEKSDVYSFTLVLWQIITSSDLFPEQTNLGQFRRAVTEGGLRPPIPSDVPELLKNLLEEGWHANPERRPGMPEFIARLNCVIQELLIPDQAARMWWIMNIGSQESIQWSRFYTVYAPVAGIPLTTDGLGRSVVPPLITLPDPVVQSMRCLHALLTCHITQSGTPFPDDPVTMDRFGSVVSWLGTWLNDHARLPVLAQELCHQPWFFGDFTVEQSVGSLGLRDMGTFLVRFSSSEIGSFTISRVVVRGSVAHTRISCKCDPSLSGRFVINGTCYSSIHTLIAGQRTALNLLVPCPASPYEKIFIPVVDSGYEGAPKVQIPMV